MRRVLSSAWLCLAAAVALAGAAFALAPSASTTAQRIAHLETLVRCPSCEDLSVAQSTTSSSLAVRREIAKDVHAGESDTQILTTIEDQYGPAVLLSPRGSPLDDLLWIVPVAVVVVGAGAVLRVTRRRP